MKATYRVGRWFREDGTSEQPFLTVETTDFVEWFDVFFDSYALPNGFYWVTEEFGGEVSDWGVFEVESEDECFFYDNLVVPPPTISLNSETLRIRKRESNPEEK